MHLIVVGLSHKTAPIEVREKLAVPASRLGEALHRLCVYPSVKEGFLLSTCNRVEVYAVVDEMEAGYAGVHSFLADTHLALTSDQLAPHLYQHIDDRAISQILGRWLFVHLFAKLIDFAGVGKDVQVMRIGLLIVAHCAP